jgi:excisionase family DNA binding protein
VTSRILYSREEAAEALSLSISTIDVMIGRGMLRARRHGRRVLIHHSEIERVSRMDLPRIWPLRKPASKENEKAKIA